MTQVIIEMELYEMLKATYDATRENKALFTLTQSDYDIYTGVKSKTTYKLIEKDELIDTMNVNFEKILKDKQQLCNSLLDEKMKVEKMSVWKFFLMKLKSQ